MRSLIIYCFYTFSNKDQLHTYSTEQESPFLIQQKIIWCFQLTGFTLNQQNRIFYPIQQRLNTDLVKHRVIL